MQTIQGAGCWPGQAEGQLLWLEPDADHGTAGHSAVDRAAELMAFRNAVDQALADLEDWSEQQETLEGRLALQPYREALLEDAWSQRTCKLIDTGGLNTCAAVLEAAEQVATLLARSAELQGRSGALCTAARWLARRISPRSLPPNVILAAQALSPLDILDRQHLAITAGPEPVVLGGPPLVWGVAGLSPTWKGRRVAVDGSRVLLDVPERPVWLLDGNHLGDLPVCRVEGDLAEIDRTAARVGRKPAVLVERHIDLAAVPLFVAKAAAVAVEMDALGRAGSLDHPGLDLLLQGAVTAARTAQIPILIGGESVLTYPERWLSRGFAALFVQANSRGTASSCYTKT